jgi:nucleotide-binding universal stress UspA family protein
MRIVCGTDFSVHAQEAGNAAAALAVRWKETLVLVHVHEEHGLEPGSDKILSALRDAARKRLREEAERLRALGAIVEEEFLMGDPWSVLVEVARRPSTRVVVLSSLGHMAPSRLLVGSVAERVAETAPVPTLVVRAAHPFEVWARGEQPLRVFAGVDFSASADAALRWIRDLRESGPCDVTVGHVNSPFLERWRLGVTGPLSLTENAPEVQRGLERDLAAKVKQWLREGKVNLRIALGLGRTDVHLMQLAREAQADLIVVGTHQRHGLERLWHSSVSRGLLHNSGTNVACVPSAVGPISEGALVPVITRVLAATDFSALGDRAIPYAFSVLGRGGQVCLVHVTSPHGGPNPLPGRSERKRPTRREHAKQLQDCVARLRALIPAEAEGRGIGTQIEVLEHRDPAVAICQMAERWGADLLCLGSHGRSGAAKAILGSVAQEVLHRGRRPLLIIRPPAP